MLELSGIGIVSQRPDEIRFKFTGWALWKAEGFDPQTFQNTVCPRCRIGFEAAANVVIYRQVDDREVFVVKVIYETGRALKIDRVL